MVGSWWCAWSTITQQTSHGGFGRVKTEAQPAAADPVPMPWMGCRATVGPAPLCSRRTSSEWPAHRRTNQNAHWAACGDGLGPPLIGEKLHIGVLIKLLLRSTVLTERGRREYLEPHRRFRPVVVARIGCRLQQPISWRICHLRARLANA